MKTAPLSLDLLRIDGGTQSRLCINDDAVEDYAEIISAAPATEWPFPPLDVFHDGSAYFVADGFHRCLGAVRAKRGSVPCVIHKGTAADARIFAMTANDRHGMRMSRADKRSNVEWLLDNCGKMPQKEIAQKAGVSPRLVQMIVADRKPKLVPQQPPPVATKAQIANLQPAEGDSDPFGEFDPSDWPEPGGEAPAAVAVKPKGKTSHSASENGKDVDYGKCPNCAGTRWKEDADGLACAKCHHPHGEPAGDVDDKQVKLQRSKTVKTVEALMRAFDDLQLLISKPAEHEKAIADCKRLLKVAGAWK